MIWYGGTMQGVSVRMPVLVLFLSSKVRVRVKDTMRVLGRAPSG